jgi:hypothetical protein
MNFILLSILQIYATFSYRYGIDISGTVAAQIILTTVPGTRKNGPSG